MPNREDLATLGAAGATLAIHLSIRNIRRVVEELTPYYGADCPAIVMVRVGWPDQRIIRGTLATIAAAVRAAKVTRTALIFVGRVFDNRDFTDSRLYHADHRHILRPRRRSSPAGG
jgi:precorrin-4/cobalt-precorrin-4 C11-methyltransferase